MQAGRLRHRITIQRPIDQQSASGAVSTAYENWLERIAAHVEPDTGDEQFVALQVQGVKLIKITIRYRPGLNEKMRVTQIMAPGSPTDTAWYDILAVLDRQGRRRELTLRCKERQAEGFRSGPPAAGPPPP